MSDLLKVRIGGSSYLCKYDLGILYTLCSKCANDRDIPIVGHQSEIFQNYQFQNPGYMFEVTRNVYLWRNLDFTNFKRAEIDLEFSGNLNNTFWMYSFAGTRIMHIDSGNQVQEVRNKQAIRFQYISDITSNVSIVSESSIVKYVVLGNVKRYEIRIDYDGEYYTYSFGSNFSNYIKFKHSSPPSSSTTIEIDRAAGSGSYITLHKLLYK